MTLTQDHTEQFQRLDIALRTDEQSKLFLTETGNSFRGWYSRLLSTLALLTPGEQIVFGSTHVDGAEARCTVFTDVRVIVANVDDVSDDQSSPFARSVPRHALKSVAVAASMGHSVKGTEVYGWPGSLRLKLAYDGLDSDIDLVADSYDRYATDNVSPIWALLELLRADQRSRDEPAV